VRLYVDEAIASAELIARLGAAGHDVLRPIRGEADDRCWRHAQEVGAVVLTMDVVDFAALAENETRHHGLLLVYRENDATRDMTTAAVAEAVGRVAAMFPDGIAGHILTLNQFR
jgi:hypothetical protein